MQQLLLVIDSLGSGGAQRQLVELAKGLAGRGYGTRLFLYYPQFDHFEAEVAAAGIEIVKAKKRSRLDPRPVRRLRQQIIRDKPDWVISFLDTPNVYALLASRGLAKTIVSERSSSLDARPFLSTRLRYSLYRQATWVTANSLHQAEQIARSIPRKRAAIRAIWNGIDLDTFSPAPTTHEASTDTSVLRLLTVGTVTASKNPLGLIEALAELRRRGHTVQLTWVGKTSADPTGVATRQQAESLLREYDLESQWLWYGETTSMEHRYLEHDALIHPSFFEGLPNVVCEALACALPVLASRVCDHPRLVQEAKTGFLFDPTNPVAIADAIGKLIALKPAERQSFRLAARRFAEQHLSIDRYIDDYVDLLEGHGRPDARLRQSRGAPR